MSENDLIKLYSGRILALAADIPHSGRLEAPMASVKKRSPLCGSTVTGMSSEVMPMMQAMLKMLEPTTLPIATALEPR